MPRLKRCGHHGEWVTESSSSFGRLAKCGWLDFLPFPFEAKVSFVCGAGYYRLLGLARMTQLEFMDHREHTAGQVWFRTIAIPKGAMHVFGLSVIFVTDHDLRSVSLNSCALRSASSVSKFELTNLGWLGFDSDDT